MASKKSFGFERKDVSSAEVQDFERYTSNIGDKYNPLRKEKLPTRSNNYQGSITSIPSPYARMHVTDIAFEELTNGIGIYSNAQMARNGQQMSEDYTRAVSHCLDIYELLFNADSLNLKEAGITIQKIRLWHLKDKLTDQDFAKLVGSSDNGTQTSLGDYIQTLDLYRDQYMADVNKRINSLGGGQQYLFDFTSLYIFKYKNKTFAATSPFTGFFAKADCDLSAADLSVRLRDGSMHKLLTPESSEYKAFDMRSNDFKEFMYTLFMETGLERIFENLFKVIKNDGYIQDNLTRLNSQNFSTDPRFRKFNIGADSPLQKIAGTTASIRPDGIDCSYLKFLLYQVEPAELTIPEISYAQPDITQRQFPDNSGHFEPWLGANDILSDSLFVLPYEINDNYKAITFYDEQDGRSKRRCLVPLKTQALKYIDINTLIQNIELKKRTDGSFLLRLTVNLQNGGTVVLRREYYTENKGFPYGQIVSGEDMKPFAFGIYPFVHSNNFNNIYKLLFYNSFEGDCSVSYYLKGANNLQHSILPDTQVEHNITNKLANTNNFLPANCEYFHLDVNTGKLAFVNIDLDNKGNALIIPEIKDIPMNNGKTTIAVDLGTSNTYVAYTHQPTGQNVSEIQEINTQHNGWNELIFMNKRCQQTDEPNARDKNRDDLYLNEDGIINQECLSAQLCEFMPSQINQNGYSFPIPSAVNMLRINDGRTNAPENIIPLVNSSIPFAYYEIGTRTSSNQTAIPDSVSDGSDFKWFSRKDHNGQWQIDSIKQKQFEAFMQELLFVLRSNMLSMGYDLNNCQLIWSYPLSFDRNLVNQYQTLWNTYFAKYFNATLNKVIYTNESLTPIYYCQSILATGGNLSLLVDIGGGSTDIIGYKNSQPQFITSFGFAGNALYLEGAMNSAINTNTTLLKRLLIDWQKSHRIGIFSRSSGNNTELISIDSKVSVLMNYGFTTDPNNFKQIFDDDPMQLILSLHNAAIFYQIAQLCKLENQSIPLDIYLTGNGSKLLDLNINLNRMVKAIFEFVYSSEINAGHLNIQNSANPKYATARGALIGLQKDMSVGTDSDNRSVVMLGDGENIFNGTIATLTADLKQDDRYKDRVKHNVKEFLHLWYSLLDMNLKNQITQNDIDTILENISSNQMLNIQGGAFSDSLFFQYISLIMEVISQKLKLRIYGNN